MTKGKRTRLHGLKKSLDNHPRFKRNVDAEHTYCYCDAWDLTWPHYQAEHDTDHDLARLMRARRADGAS